MERIVFMRQHLFCLVVLVLAGCGASPQAQPTKQSTIPGLYSGLVPLTPKEQAESEKEAKEMEADNARLIAVSLRALIPVLKEKGYSKPDDTTVVGSHFSDPGESFLMGACLGPDGKPHKLLVHFNCTKFGKEYTVDLREVSIDSETVWSALAD